MKMPDYHHVPGAQLTRREREFLRETAETIVGSLFAVGGNWPVFVNIGVMWGASMWCLRAGCPEAHLWGVDIALDRWPIHDKEKLQAHWLEGDSRVLWRDFTKGINLLLVDGDHHYETVKADIEGWVPLVVPGGIVVFHDYAPTALNLRQFPELEGVRRAVRGWQSSPRGEEWLELAAPDSMAAFGRIPND